MAGNRTSKPPPDAKPSRPQRTMLKYIGPDLFYRNPRRGVDEAVKGEPFEASELAMQHIPYLIQQGFQRV